MDPTADVRTVTVATGRLARWIDGFIERHGLAEDSRDAIAADATTVRLIGADGARAWIDVPFPPLDGGPGAPDGLDGLLRHSARERRIGVLLVRRGGHAAGVFEGTALVASKVGSSYVQGTTKAGGWSQQRYARRRANQASAAFATAAEDAARVLLGHDLEALVTGGDKQAVLAVLDDRRLAHLAPLVTGPWLQVKDPRLRVLAATPEQFLVVRIRLDP